MESAISALRVLWESSCWVGNFTSARGGTGGKLARVDSDTTSRIFPQLFRIPPGASQVTLSCMSTHPAFVPGLLVLAVSSGVAGYLLREHTGPDPQQSMIREARKLMQTGRTVEVYTAGPGGYRGKLSGTNDHWLVVITPRKVLWVNPAQVAFLDAGPSQYAEDE
jgi:hypothetical protein